MKGIDVLNDALANDYMNRFYGYGSWKASYWFVGIEEGGGNAVDEVKRRMDTWNRRGRRDIEDMREFHTEAEIGDWFGSSARIQLTWGPLIRALLVSQDKDSSEMSILDYQRQQLGAVNGETAIIENLPLPARGRKQRDWHYGDWSGLEALRDRKTYEREYLTRRADHIVARIRLCTPRSVVFHGNRQIWAERFQLEPTPSFQTSVGLWRNNILLIATDQPTAHTNDSVPRFTAIGKIIAEKALR